MSVIYITNEATERIHLGNENLGVTVLRQVKLSLRMKRGQAASFIPRWICIHLQLQTCRDCGIIYRIETAPFLCNNMAI